jgi:ATP-dependent Zn protease
LNPFYWLRPSERKATLKVVSHQNGKVVYESWVDFTNDAKFMKQIPILDAWGTAIHEAGHAVLKPGSLDHLTIVPSGDHLGYARYKPRPLGAVFDRGVLVREIAVNLAGSVAEEMIGRPRNMGATGDINQTREILRKTLVEGSLIKELDGAMVGPDGKLVMNAQTQRLIDDYAKVVMNDAAEFARKEITRQWPAMIGVSKRLIKSGSISGDEFRAIAKKANAVGTKITPDQIRLYIERLSHKCKNLLMDELK